jgi:hypothetical protein
MSLRAMFLPLFTAVSLMTLAGCAADGVPMIGLDDKNQYIERFAEEGQYQQMMGQTVNQVQDSTFPALYATQGETSGMLRSLSVGLGFTFEGGLGPIVKIGVSPKIRFVFSNSTKPFIP